MKSVNLSTVYNEDVYTQFFNAWVSRPDTCSKWDRFADLVKPMPYPHDPIIIHDIVLRKLAEQLNCSLGSPEMAEAIKELPIYSYRDYLVLERYTERHSYICERYSSIISELLHACTLLERVQADVAHPDKTQELLILEKIDDLAYDAAKTIQGLVGCYSLKKGIRRTSVSYLVRKHFNLGY